MELDAADIIAMHDLVNRYGHVLDEQRWADLDAVFTDDVIVDFSVLGLPLLKGVDAVKAAFSGHQNPPLAHHVTNIVVSCQGEEAHAVSKGLMILANGSLSSWIYRDRFRKVGRAWRIANRIGTRLAPAAAAS